MIVASYVLVNHVVWLTQSKYWEEWAVFRRFSQNRGKNRLLASSCLYVLSVWSSVRIEQLGYHVMDFHEIWYLGIYRNICRGNSSFIRIWQEEQVLYMKTNIHFWSYLTHFFLEWKIFQAKVVDKIKTHILLVGQVTWQFGACAFYAW
jgi:hypothetical protein